MDLSPISESILWTCVNLSGFREPRVHLQHEPDSLVCEDKGLPREDILLYWPP